MLILIRVIAMRRILLLLLPLCLLIVGCWEEPKSVGLKAGQIAPPLEGKDIDGKPIKLRDYRGKVVVIDFWGPWCPACVRAIPHEKELLKRFEGKPFTILSVSVSNSSDELRDFLKKTPLPWPNIAENQPSPLADDWRIKFFPTFHIIDAQGVIRFRNAEVDEIEPAVNELLKEMEKKSS